MSGAPNSALAVSWKPSEVTQRACVCSRYRVAMLLTSKRVSHKHKTLFTVEGGGGASGVQGVVQAIFYEVHCCASAPCLLEL